MSCPRSKSRYSTVESNPEWGAAVFGKWKIHRSSDHEGSVEVSEKDGIRSLHLGSETVQSSMKLADPTELVLSYTRP